jgi:hypothetical protein
MVHPSLQTNRRQRYSTQCSQMQHHRNRLQGEVSTTDNYIINSSTPWNYLAGTIRTTIIPRSPRSARKSTHGLQPTRRNRIDSRSISQSESTARSSLRRQKQRQDNTRLTWICITTSIAITILITTTVVLCNSYVSTKFCNFVHGPNSKKSTPSNVSEQVSPAKAENSDAQPPVKPCNTTLWKKKQRRATHHSTYPDYKRPNVNYYQCKVVVYRQTRNHKWNNQTTALNKQ